MIARTHTPFALVQTKPESVSYRDRAGASGTKFYQKKDSRDGEQ